MEVKYFVNSSVFILKYLRQQKGLFTAGDLTNSRAPTYFRKEI